jgi:hypothetical protein
MRPLTLKKVQVWLRYHTAAWKQDFKYGPMSRYWRAPSPNLRSGLICGEYRQCKRLENIAANIHADRGRVSCSTPKMSSTYSV